MTTDHMTLPLNDHDVDVLLDALAMAASRHESQGRWHGGGATARRHDEQAHAMRQLRVRILKLSVTS